MAKKFNKDDTQQKSVLVSEFKDLCTDSGWKVVFSKACDRVNLVCPDGGVVYSSINHIACQQVAFTEYGVDIVSWKNL